MTRIYKIEPKQIITTDLFLYLKRRVSTNLLLFRACNQIWTQCTERQYKDLLKLVENY